jgi:hypothetical protein
MSEKEFLVQVENVSVHLSALVEDLLPEEQEDVCIALFNVKTRIVTDEEDGRTFSNSPKPCL